MPARREIEVEATPEDVWEALATEEGRERWLDEPGPRGPRRGRPSAPHRLVWWWWEGDGPRRASSSWSSPAPAGRARGGDRDRARRCRSPAWRHAFAPALRVSDPLGRGLRRAGRPDPARASSRRCCTTASTSVPALTDRLPDHPPGGRQAPRHARRRGPGGARARAAGARCATGCARGRCTPPRSGCAPPSAPGTTAWRASSGASRATLRRPGSSAPPGRPRRRPGAAPPPRCARVAARARRCPRRSRTPRPRAG